MEDDASNPDPWARLDTGIDTTRPQSARVWNYILGGKDHFPVDAAAGAGMDPGLS